MRARVGMLYKSDFGINMDWGILVVDVQVSWESNTCSMVVVWDLKRHVYDQPHFREAAVRRWPRGSFRFCPVILGAFGPDATR